ncbi:hypothetical protein D3C73_1610490 [compost metagenome]
MPLSFPTGETTHMAGTLREGIHRSKSVRTTVLTELVAIASEYAFDRSESR